MITPFWAQEPIQRLVFNFCMERRDPTPPSSHDSSPKTQGLEGEGPIPEFELIEKTKFPKEAVLTPELPEKSWGYVLLKERAWAFLALGEQIGKIPLVLISYFVRKLLEKLTKKSWDHEIYWSAACLYTRGIGYSLLTIFLPHLGISWAFSYFRKNLMFGDPCVKGEMSYWKQMQLIGQYSRKEEYVQKV